MGGFGDFLGRAALGAAVGWGNGVVDQAKARQAAAIEKLRMEREDAQRQEDHDWRMEEIGYRDALSDGNRRARGGGGGGGGTQYRFLTPEEIEAQGLDPTKNWQMNQKNGAVTSKGARGGAAAGPSYLSQEEMAEGGLDPAKVWIRGKDGAPKAVGARATDESYAPAIDEAATAAGVGSLPPDVRAKVNQRVRAGEDPNEVMKSLEIEDEVTNPGGTMFSRATGWTPEDAPPDETVKRVTGIKNVPDAPTAPPAAGTQPQGDNRPRTTSAGQPDPNAQPEASAALAEARAAIAKGAPREAVIARLRSMGIPTDGL